MSRNFCPLIAAAHVKKIVFSSIRVIIIMIMHPVDQEVDNIVDFLFDFFRLFPLDLHFFYLFNASVNELTVVGCISIAIGI